MNPVIIIPARMAAARFPGKPLATIAGKAMLLHVIDRAMESGVGEVVVACSEKEVKAVVEAAGHTAILTDPELPSGTDRIWAALQEFDPAGKYDTIINVQGDLPTLEPKLIRESLIPFSEPEADITTLVAEIRIAEEKTNPNVVKAVIAWGEEGTGRALYFSRATVPANDGPLYHHIGLYAYRRSALERFVALPPSALEKREKLEQLRALEAGMRMDAVRVNTVPLGVDTPEDAKRAEKMLLKKC